MPVLTKLPPATCDFHDDADGDADLENRVCGTTRRWAQQCRVKCPLWRGRAPKATNPRPFRVRPFQSCVDQSRRDSDRLVFIGYLLFSKDPDEASAGLLRCGAQDDLK